MIKKFYIFGCMEDITFKVVRSPHGLTYNLMCYYYDDFRWFQCGILPTNSEGEKYECYEEIRYNNDPLSMVKMGDASYSRYVL